MHDIKLVRSHAIAFRDAMIRRGLETEGLRNLIAELVKTDETLRQTKASLENARAIKKQKSREIGAAKAAGDNDGAALMIAAVEALERVNADQVAASEEAVRGT